MGDNVFVLLSEGGVLGKVFPALSMILTVGLYLRGDDVTSI